MSLPCALLDNRAKQIRINLSAYLLEKLTLLYNISHRLLLHAARLVDILERIDFLCPSVLDNANLGGLDQMQSGAEWREMTDLAESALANGAMEVKVEEVDFSVEVDRVGKAAENAGHSRTIEMKKVKESRGIGWGEERYTEEEQRGGDKGRSLDRHEMWRGQMADSRRRTRNKDQQNRPTLRRA